MHLLDVPGAPPSVTVSHLSLYLKELLEANDILQNIWVRGEVSNCKTYPSGHCYFTLKDGDAQLHCVFFKSARMRTAAPSLENGMALLANGRVSFYERDGRLQFYVDAVQPLGEGALFQRFQQLKDQLSAEGLFDEERKRPLPAIPSVIGIVTSLQAAALRDMLHVLSKRFPLAQVIVSPTSVQGADAPESIATALDLLNEHGEADVIIVGRGGGSIEELWAFNEEVVARAIARSRIPVISGVGHETDFTIADFVADHRAPTPSAAAVAAVPDIAEWKIALRERLQRLNSSFEELIEDRQERLTYALQELQHVSPQRTIIQRKQQIDECTDRLQSYMQHMLELRAERLRSLALQLHSLSPLLTIARGYAVVRRERDQAIVTSVKQVQLGESLSVQVQDGQISVAVRSL